MKSGLTETGVSYPLFSKIMSFLDNLIERCQQRHEKPLRQRKTMVTPALYNKGHLYQLTVYCAQRYPVLLAELEPADISFMPIGHASENDRGPRDLGGARFLKCQGIRDWGMRRWRASWGIQIYTGTASEHTGGRWHDIDFKYEAISAAPDAVFACIETLLSTVESPLLTISKSGGLRFSCRVLDYLHPNTKDSKLYIYKRTPIPENPHQRDVYLEVLGENSYSRWDARYEILLGNLLDPPLIPKEVLFAPIDALRAELHEPIPLEEQKLEDAPQVVSIAPSSLGSHNLDLAKEALLKRGFSYVRQENGFHHWTQPVGTVSTRTRITMGARWHCVGTRFYT